MTHVKTDWRQVGLRLKRELNFRRMKVKDLARLVEVAPHTPYKWMRGGTMEDKHLERVAAVLGMSPAVLRYGASSISLPDYSDAATVAYKVFEEIDPKASIEAKTAVATQLYQLKMDLGVSVDDGRLLEYARTLVANMILKTRPRP